MLYKKILNTIQKSFLFNYLLLLNLLILIFFISDLNIY